MEISHNLSKLTQFTPFVNVINNYQQLFDFKRRSVNETTIDSRARIILLISLWILWLTWCMFRIKAFNYSVHLVMLIVIIAEFPEQWFFIEYYFDRWNRFHIKYIWRHLLHSNFTFSINTVDFELLNAYWLQLSLSRCVQCLPLSNFAHWIAWDISLFEINWSMLRLSVSLEWWFQSLFYFFLVFIFFRWNSPHKLA